MMMSTLNNEVASYTFFNNCITQRYVWDDIHFLYLVMGLYYLYMLYDEQGVCLLTNIIYVVVVLQEDFQIFSHHAIC